MTFFGPNSFGKMIFGTQIIDSWYFQNFRFRYDHLKNRLKKKCDFFFFFFKIENRKKNLEMQKKKKNPQKCVKTPGIDFPWVLHYSFFLFHLLKVSGKKVTSNYFKCLNPPIQGQFQCAFVLWGVAKITFLGHVASSLRPKNHKIILKWSKNCISTNFQT